MRPHKHVTLLCASAAVAIGAAALAPSAAFAHGFVGDDSGDPTHTLTARVAMQANGDMGGAQYDPQSLEAPKGFPAAGPADGHLASAGHTEWSVLDEQGEDRWQKNVVEQGDVTVNWTYTAPHKTSQWRYYMTKDGWDPNDALDRDDLELIETVEHDGSEASNNPSHEITIPSDREGYHVIYAVWDVADTANAFYNVIDVDVQPGDGETPEPVEDTEAPGLVPDAAGRAVSSTEAEITWGAASDDRGVARYQVVRLGATEGDFQVVKEVSATGRSARLTGLQPGEVYSFGVRAVDAAGNVGLAHTILTVRMPEQAAAPAAPKHLHDMGTTESTVALMWTAGDDTEGVRYEVFRDGDKVGETGATDFVDVGLRAGSRHEYTVRAVNLDGIASAMSNRHVTTTKGDAASEYPTWDAHAAYTKGDRVTHGGSVYEAVQSYQGHGDPNWITAPSLWKPVS
ncbi:chitin-binding protein [Curtobacterium sp. MCSS17_008]|uniref:lytic polysaccharide monooxygenase n=1 Tax=Curtobacterium sp. MCSS17_008 TaxID=2175647 RepID=UPI000DAA5C5D|nr:lytic polysaccharide monooxygenase [Curtobacterium sp. MCSS17_008]PZF58168.1 chitin-binding protein [Curtobacterium sp. MCSS17_008]